MELGRASHSVPFHLPLAGKSCRPARRRRALKHGVLEEHGHEHGSYSSGFNPVHTRLPPIRITATCMRGRTLLLRLQGFYLPYFPFATRRRGASIRPHKHKYAGDACCPGNVFPRLKLSESQWSPPAERMSIYKLLLR